MSVRRLNSIITLVISILILAGCRWSESEPSSSVRLTATPGASIPLETEVNATLRNLKPPPGEAAPPTAVSSFEGLSLSEFFEASPRSDPAQSGNGANLWLNRHLRGHRGQA